MNKNILECRDINKFFIKNGNKNIILNNINLNIKEKEITVIFGKSGEGKSVLLWILSGIDNPSSGEIIYNGISLNDLSTEKLAVLYRENISFIFQDFNFIPTWTVMENIESALLHKNINNKEKRSMVMKMLEDVGLSDKQDHLPHELSIGQRQRAAIARSLVTKPRIIFADEPTGGMDDETANPIIKILTGYIKKNNASLIVATHGVFPKNIADRLLILKNTKLLDLKPN
jgi:putative ABC transport system ATP-binding protein